jgi:hypothetical protein
MRTDRRPLTAAFGRSSAATRLAIIVTLSLTGAVTLAQADPLDQSRITGRVLDAAGAILPNAIVVIQHWEHPPGEKSVLRPDCRVG